MTILPTNTEQASPGLVHISTVINELMNEFTMTTPPTDPDGESVELEVAA